MISLLKYSKYNSVLLKPRCRNSWSSCYQPIASAVALPLHSLSAVSLLSAPSNTLSSPSIIRLEEDSTFHSPPLSPAPTHSPEPDTSTFKEPSEALHVVETQFDFDEITNKNVTDRYNPSDEVSSYDYTQKQREFAAGAIRTNSLEDISKKVA